MNALLETDVRPYVVVLWGGRREVSVSKIVYGVKNGSVSSWIRLFLAASWAPSFDAQLWFGG